MTSAEIRQKFLDFFEEKQHKIVHSSPVVPYDDPTLLFANAGMNQFKDVFLGTGRREYSRAADTQKCIRVSGKHNDLEEVGHDTYHHTFFEMLGNWSFGDYYKKEAIMWAWELLTERYSLPKERLWVTVYRTDDEALEIWKNHTDINPDHILKFDEKDNFWEMGDTGPCGPCSEIHINISDDYDNPKYVNAGRPDCIEIWNLVFIQFNRDENGVLHNLPATHVDTGMGFERLCAVIQGKASNYDTDIFRPLIRKIEEISGADYTDTNDIIPIRVIADHIRTLTFAIGDGAVPGNEGRGYVLRRILRRASRYGRKLNLKEPFLFKLVDTLTEQMGHVFPEIVAKADYIKKIIKIEEDHFNKTLDRGLELFEAVASEMRAGGVKVFSGENSFKLYDTFGFPLDLTRILAAENGFELDEKGFENLMHEQRERAREASKSKFAGVAVIPAGLDQFITEEGGESKFAGYDDYSLKGRIIGYKKEDNVDLVILDKTPFYVEAGGQIDDTGIIKAGDTKLIVPDVFKVEGQTVHVLENPAQSTLSTGMEVEAVIDYRRRMDIMRNHSATHFMHSALRKVLGTHVQQAGSYVGPDRLRFDFTHYQKVTPEELREIEIIVNEELRKNVPLMHHRNVPIEKAQKMGALMFFGDKYGDFVNVVQFGDYSMEFCGGTHVKNSAEIGIFKIISESSIASGVRRIEAVTGAGVEQYIYSQIARAKEHEDKIAELHEEKKKLEKEIAGLKLKDKLSQVDSVIAAVTAFEGINLYSGKVEVSDNEELKNLGDELRLKMVNGVGLLVAVIDSKVGLVCTVSDSLMKEKNLSAGKIVGDIAKILGGGGGGRPHLATAGARDIDNIDKAIASLRETVKKYI